jgi:phosphate transport system protein
MHNQDSELAKRVIDGDKQVNMMEVAIDEACGAVRQILSATSPMRSSSAIVLMIAITRRRSLAVGFSQQHQPLLVSLESLGRHTVQMLHDVLDAFARMDFIRHIANAFQLSDSLDDRHHQAQVAGGRLALGDA